MDLQPTVKGNAKLSNLNKIQRLQNITLRKITISPPYVSNYTLYKDHMKTIHEEAKTHYKRLHLRLNTNPNPLIKNLTTLAIPGNPSHHLKQIVQTC